MLALLAKDKQLLQCIKATHQHSARALTPTLSLSISLPDAFATFKNQTDIILGRKPCHFQANGKLIFTGYIDKVSAASEKLEATVSMRSATSVLIDSNFELPQGSTPQSIATIIRNIASHFSLTVEDLSYGKAELTKSLFRYESDEKAFTVLSRYAKLAGVYLSTNEKGMLTILDPNAKRESYVLPNYTSLSISQNNAKLFAAYSVKSMEWLQTYCKEDKAEEKDEGPNKKKIQIVINEDTSESTKNVAETNKQNARRESLSVTIKATPINYSLKSGSLVVVPSIAKTPFVVEKISREWQDSSENMGLQLAPNAGSGQLYSFAHFLKEPAAKEFA